ncbi:ATP-binding protein [Salipiger bermudensis]|uniref:ATP-binding protein n=1 Tax=Salipiger bermudensis TaxID=344736 RepID=UPI001CD50DC0|nr:ATP-binding protein [Salipiger bermudensis]MCA0963795.1 sensor histidine kinase N-terminal domain-containing protein [Salipiger bermudensis]
MSSIRGRLLAILLLATGVIWLSAALWTQISTRAQVIQVLDRRLEESARMVASLIREGGLSVDQAARAARMERADADGFHLLHQLSCQIWGLDGTLISESAGAPEGRLSEAGGGFSENEVDGELWRVFTLADPELDFRVMVGDAQAMRDQLVRNVTLGQLAPTALMLPLLAALIWLTVGRGLRPLDRLGAALSNRPASDLGPLEEAPAPRELRPMIAALNGLLRRVDAARERERSFTAFAAHELKTPLAGLQTQAEIARMAPDTATRTRALVQIEQGVKRTDRMVKQLLAMTAVEHPPNAASGAPQDGAALLQAVADDLAPLAGRLGVGLQVSATPGLWSTAEATLLQTALRNLVENALHASPQGETVSATLSLEGAGAVFEISDRGPGISEAERPHVTERFFRGAGATTSGSGLGLAIVATSAARLGGALELSPREGGGECARLILPR